MELAANKTLEISRSSLAKVRRLMQYFVRYILAKSQSQTLGMLLPIIENSFRHPWVAEVQLQIGFWPTRGLPLRWNANRERSLLHWDAPVGIAVSGDPSYRCPKGPRSLAKDVYGGLSNVCLPTKI